jgi:hypothetical protein
MLILIVQHIAKREAELQAPNFEMLENVILKNNHFKGTETNTCSYSLNYLEGNMCYKNTQKKKGQYITQ